MPIYKSSRATDSLATFERSVSTLIYDSFFLLRRAKSEEDPETALLFARHSAVSSALLLEAVANNLLDSLDAPSTLYAAYERMGTIAKYELYLHLAHNKAIDHSRNEVQVARAIKVMRDDIAHPKSTKLEWEEHRDEDGDVTHLSGKFKKRKGIEIPIDFSAIEIDGAIEVSRGVHRFIAYVLLDISQLKLDECWALLSSKDEVPRTDGAWEIRTELIDWYHEIRSWGITIDHFTRPPEDY